MTKSATVTGADLASVGEGASSEGEPAVDVTKTERSDLVIEPIKETEMSEENKNELNEKIEAVQKAATEALETVKKAHALEIEELKKANQSLKDERALETWVNIAEKDLSHVPGKTSAELGKMLFDLDKLSPEVAKTQREILKAASDSVKKSAMLQSSGAPAIDKPGSALDRMNALADGLVAKSSGMSREKAFTQIMRSNPKLYEEYLREHPQQATGV